MVDPEIIERLQQAAHEAAGHAYAPYSNFRVGAALLFEDGTISAGCNVENVSYSLTICAERTALVKAIAESGAGRKIVAVVVTNMNHTTCHPCGACLQMLSEFTAADAVAVFPTQSGMETRPFRELLPYAFTDWKNDARR